MSCTEQLEINDIIEDKSCEWHTWSKEIITLQNIWLNHDANNEYNGEHKTDDKQRQTKRNIKQRIMICYGKLIKVFFL